VFGFFIYLEDNNGFNIESNKKKIGIYVYNDLHALLSADVQIGMDSDRER